MAFPTTNLSMKYVCYHFGYLRARLSTLCTHPDINIWSKYKPVQHAQPRPSDWWKGGNGHCGIGILGHANFEDMMDSILSGAAQYYHEQPIIYCLGDFCGYAPDAVPPFFEVGIPDQVYTTQQEMTLTYAMQTGTAEGGFSVDDIFSRFDGSGYHMGAAFIRTDGTAFWMTGTENSVTIPISAYQSNIFQPNSTLRVIQFITPRSKPGFLSSITGGGLFYGLPLGQVRTLEVRSSNYICSLTAQYNAAQNTITGTIHLEVAGTSYTFNNVTVNFSYPSSTEFRATTGNLGSYSLRDGESKEISYSVSAQSLKQNGVFLGAKGWLFASNVNYATTIVLMEKPSN